MASTLSVSIVADSSALQPVFDQLLEHLSKRSLEVRQLALDRLQRLSQAGCVHVETLPATAANQVRIALEPSQAFLDLVAAVRAGNVDFL
jgi:hypothetical protein